jgi:hypothetical protein
MGRELRRVPANWQHPKKSNGEYQPMFDTYYGDVLKKWIDDNSQWNEGTHKDLLEGRASKEEYPFYAMWAGNPPDIEYYHTRRYSESELTHIQLYESTSEGTPLSPVFPADQLDKLCEWAEKNATTFASFRASKEEWFKMLSNDFVFHKSGNAIFI